MDDIADGYADSALPARWKAAIGWTDVVIGAPETSVEPAAAAARAAFSPAELAELTLTVAVAQGFSKAAIAWGPAPTLPTTTIPTPGG